MTSTSPTTPSASRVARWLPALLAALLLAVGGFALFVRHAPATTWAVPVQPGPLVEGSTVWALRRAPGEVRVDVGPKGETATVRIVDRHHPDHADGELATARTRLLPDGSRNRAATPAEVRALADRVAAWEDRWPRPPPFVAPVGHRPSPLQRAEEVVLEGLILLWLAGLVLTARDWLPARGSRLGVLAALLVGLQHAVGAALPLAGVWHSNQHGYDRIADVAAQTPPAFAALGLLHGLGYYALFEPLAAWTGRGVLDLAPWVASATLLAAIAWLRLLWGDLRAVALGALALGGTAVFLRLSASEDMYVPTQLWLVAALALLERYLRDDRDRWLLLALPPAFLAMQTRAEMMALVPAWAGLMVVVRRPGWLRTAWRRPAVVGGLLVAAGLFVPRLLALRASPPPEDLRRASVDPLRDPRLLFLAAVVALGVALLPPVSRRLAGLSRRTWGGLAALLALLLAAWWAAVRPSGGPLEHTWEVHAALDPIVTGPGLALAAAGGVIAGARRDAAATAWLVLAFALGLAVYLPQYDCFSTYVRTSMATWPFLAALVAPAALAAGPWRWAAPLLVAATAAWVPGWQVLLDRDAKQLQWDEVERVDATLPPDAVLVWLSDDDVPADARRRGFRTTRARLDAWLPDRRTLGIDAWRRGEAPVDAPTFFVRTADCHRVLFQQRGAKALAGDVETTWRYLDASRVSRGPRVVVDVAADWIDPRCAGVLAAASATLSETPLPAESSGSTYESLLGRPALGLYRIPSRLPSAP